MIATPVLYLQSKFELAGMNTCGSVVVRVDVCFVTESQKWRRIIYSNFMQSSCVKLGEGATDAYKKIQKAFGNDSLPHTQVFRWHKDFVNGQETVED
jgi:hypothetical protein